MITTKQLEIFRQKAFPAETQHFEYGQKFILNRMESVMLTCAPSQTESVLNTRIHNDQVILKTLEYMTVIDSHTVLTIDEISARLDDCLIIFKHYLINRYNKETISSITINFPIRTYNTDPYAIPQWLFTIYSIIFLKMNMMFITASYEYYPLFLFDPSYTHIHVIKVHEEANHLVLLSQDHILHSAFPVSNLYESKKLVNTLLQYPTMHDQLDSALLLKFVKRPETVYQNTWLGYFHTATSRWHHERLDINSSLNVTSIIDADTLQNMAKDTIKLYRMFKFKCTMSSSIVQEYLERNKIECDNRTFKVNTRSLAALRFKSSDYSFQDLCTFLVFIHRGEMWTREILRAKIFEPYYKLHTRSYLFGVNAILAYLCTYLKVNIVELKGKSIIDDILIKSDFHCTYTVIKIEGNLSIVYQLHNNGYIFDFQDKQRPIENEYDELKKKLDRAKQEDEKKAAADAKQERRKRHIAEVEKKPLNMKKITKANELRGTDEKYSEQYIKEVDDQLFQRKKIREAQQQLRDRRIKQFSIDFKQHVPVQYPSSEPKLKRNTQKQTIIPKPVYEKKATHSFEKTPKVAKVMVRDKNRVKSDENTYDPRHDNDIKRHDNDVHKKYKRVLKSTYTDADLKTAGDKFRADHDRRVQQRRIEAEAKAEQLRKEAEQLRIEAEKEAAERRRQEAERRHQATVARIAAEKNAAIERKQQRRALREETREQRKLLQQEAGIIKKRERAERKELQRTLEIAEQQNRSRAIRAIQEEKQRQAEETRQAALREEEKNRQAILEEENKRKAELEEEENKRQAKLEEIRQEDERKRLAKLEEKRLEGLAKLEEKRLEEHQKEEEKKRQAKLEENRLLTSERLMHLYFQIEKETNGFVFLKVPNEFKAFAISFIINLIQYASGQNYVNNIKALSETLPFDTIAQRCPDINIHMLSASGLTKIPSESKTRLIVVLYKTTRDVVYIVAKRKGHDKIDVFYNPPDQISSRKTKPKSTFEFPNEFYNPTDEIKQISLPKTKPKSILEFPNPSKSVLPNPSESVFRQTWNNMKKAIRRVFRITPTPRPAPAPAQPFYFKRKDDSKSPNPSRGRDVKKQWITFRPKNPAIADPAPPAAAPAPPAAAPAIADPVKKQKPSKKHKRHSKKDKERSHHSRQSRDPQQASRTGEVLRSSEGLRKHRSKQPNENPYGDPQEANRALLVRRILRTVKAKGESQPE